MLKLELLDATLRRLAGESGHRPEGWDDGEIRHFLLIAQCAQAAKVEADLYALRILRLRPNPDNTRMSCVQLSAHRRLTITFNAESGPLIAQFDLALLGMEIPK